MEIIHNLLTIMKPSYRPRVLWYRCFCESLRVKIVWIFAKHQNGHNFHLCCTICKHPLAILFLGQLHHENESKSSNVLWLTVARLPFCFELRYWPFYILLCSWKHILISKCVFNRFSTLYCLSDQHFNWYNVSLIVTFRLQ